MDTKTSPAWISAPGAYHLPIEGRPSAGDATLLNGHPHETLTLGTIAGRALVIEAESLEWLDELEYQLQLARARLSMLTPRPLAGAA